MYKKCFVVIGAIFFAFQLAAMDKTLTDLDAHCIRAIARYTNHESCANVRKACRFLNKTFWNDCAPIDIRPDSTTRDIPEEKFWKQLLEKLFAAEKMIAVFNQTIDVEKVAIPNAIILKLGWFRLFSFLPKDLRKSVYVRSLDLSDARVPESELAKLPCLLPFLCELKIVGNGLGRIPAEFRKWMSLRRLYLGGNGRVRSSLYANVPLQLEYIDISHFGRQGISNYVPQFLGLLHQLKGLDLSNIGQFLPHELSKLPTLTPQLEELDLSNNCIADLPYNFKDFKYLLRLNLSGNQLNASNFFFAAAKFLPKLEELDISNNRLSFSHLSRLGQYPNLKVLRLGQPLINESEESKMNCFSDEEKMIIQNWFPQAKVIF